MKNLNRILKWLRTFGHYNQKDIAKELGISRSYISEIESGKKIPSMEILQKYSDFFEIPVSVIMLFAEEIDDKKTLKKKAKALVVKGTVTLLKWICEDKTI